MGVPVMLDSVPVGLRRLTRKTVVLSVMEAELYAAVMTVQDMLYVLNMLESIGLTAHLPMILEVDNKGAVDLENSWSVGGVHVTLMCNRPT